VKTSVVDLHCFDADPDFHFDADPDPDPVPERHQYDADPHANPTPSFPMLKNRNFFPSHQYQSTLVYPSCRRLIGVIDTDPAPPVPGRHASMLIPIRQMMRIRPDTRSTTLATALLLQRHAPIRGQI
jgi:hypothetical protein